MLSSGVGAVILWWVLTLVWWVGVPLALIYTVRRAFQAYERRTQAMARLTALTELEARVAALEAGRPEAATPSPHAGRAT